MERLSKHKADDENWRAARRPPQDVNDLRDAIAALQSTLVTNIRLMERVIQLKSTASDQTSRLVESSNAAAEKRNKARTTLEREKDFLTSDELIVMIDILGRSNDHVDAHLLLATSPGARIDEVRHAWLRMRITEATSANAGNGHSSTP